MGLQSVLRSGVAVINTVVGDLRSLVTFRRMISDDEAGDPVEYAPDVKLYACVDWRATHMRTTSGEIILTKPTIIFVDIPALDAATGGNGVTDNDIIILQDGTTGPIIALSGYINPGTSKPFATEATLG